MSRDSLATSIPQDEVPHVLAFNRVLFEDDRHPLSLRGVRVHSRGVVVFLDRVFRRLAGEDQLAYRLAVMESHGVGEGTLVDRSGVDSHRNGAAAGGSTPDAHRIVRPQGILDSASVSCAGSAAHTP